MVAFVISATTVLPALSSFCTYAALGVLALYVLQVKLVTGRPRDDLFLYVHARLDLHK